MTDAARSPDDIDKLREAKGPGDFRNRVMYAPSGKEKCPQIIPTGGGGSERRTLQRQEREA
jgi:capsid portal protein